MWDGILPDQKLKLEPLLAMHAMMILLRWKLPRPSEEVTDEKVMEELDRLERNNLLEYNAVKELASSNKEHGLGGLPLALAQALGYVSRFNASFGEYLKLYKKRNCCFGKSRRMLNLQKNSVQFGQLGRST